MQGDGPLRKYPPRHSTQRLRPLANHPELEIFRTKIGETWVNEYRVANFRTLDSGRTVTGDGSLGVVDLLGLGAAVWLIHHRLWGEALAWTASNRWNALYESWTVRLVVTLLLVVLCRPRKRLHQSVLAIPGTGVQLEKTKSLVLPFLACRCLAYSTSKTFIPVNDISTVVVNEGLRRWSVRYFLAVIERDGRGIHVAFDAVTPRHAVLLEVFHGVRETLFDEWADDLADID